MTQEIILISRKHCSLDAIRASIYEAVSRILRGTKVELGKGMLDLEVKTTKAGLELVNKCADEVAQRSGVIIVAEGVKVPEKLDTAEFTKFKIPFLAELEFVVVAEGSLLFYNKDAYGPPPQLAKDAIVFNFIDKQNVINFILIVSDAVLDKELKYKAAQEFLHQKQMPKFLGETKSFNWYDLDRGLRIASGLEIINQ